MESREVVGMIKLGIRHKENWIILTFICTFIYSGLRHFIFVVKPEMKPSYRKRSRIGQMTFFRGKTVLKITTLVKSL